MLPLVVVLCYNKFSDTKPKPLHRTANYVNYSVLETGVQILTFIMSC